MANPLGALWSASMMLDHLGRPEAGKQMMDAVRAVLAEGRVRTRDLGGDAGTDEFTAEVLRRLP